MDINLNFLRKVQLLKTDQIKTDHRLAMIEEAQPFQL